MSLRDNPIVAKVSRYGCLAMLGYCLGVGLTFTTGSWIVWLPLIVIAAILVITRKVKEPGGILRSREVQKGLFFLMFMTGLIGLALLRLEIYADQQHNALRTGLVDLADIESGKVRSLPEKLRLTGPIACLYGRGYAGHTNKEQPSQETVWCFPIASRKHPLFYDAGTPDGASAPTFSVYLVADITKVPHRGRATVSGIETYRDGGTLPLPPSRGGTAQTPRPRFALGYQPPAAGQEDEVPISYGNIYVFCTLLTIGLSTFLGLCLRRERESGMEL